MGSEKKKWGKKKKVGSSNKQQAPAVKGVGFRKKKTEKIVTNGVKAAQKTLPSGPGSPQDGDNRKKPRKDPRGQGQTEKHYAQANTDWENLAGNGANWSLPLRKRQKGKLTPCEKLWLRRMRKKKTKEGRKKEMPREAIHRQGKKWGGAGGMGKNQQETKNSRARLGKEGTEKKGVVTHLATGEGRLGGGETGGEQRYRPEGGKKKKKTAGGGKKKRVQHGPEKKKNKNGAHDAGRRKRRTIPRKKNLARIWERRGQKKGDKSEYPEARKVGAKERKKLLKSTKKREKQKGPLAAYHTEKKTRQPSFFWEKKGETCHRMTNQDKREGPQPKKKGQKKRENGATSRQQKKRPNCPIRQVVSSHQKGCQKKKKKDQVPRHWGRRKGETREVKRDGTPSGLPREKKGKKKTGPRPPTAKKWTTPIPRGESHRGGRL